MKRRDFLAGVALAATFQPVNAQQPNRVYRIGYLGINLPTSRSIAEVWEAFDEGLRAHGLVEGVNVILRRLFSEGREERQPGLSPISLSGRQMSSSAAHPPVHKPLAPQPRQSLSSWQLLGTPTE